MQSRIKLYEKYRTRIGLTPDWAFKLKTKNSSKHSFDEGALNGKSISSDAIILQGENKKKRIVGYEKYKQRKQTMNILKFTLFVVAVIFMIVLYVLWVR